MARGHSPRSGAKVPPVVPRRARLPLQPAHNDYGGFSDPDWHPLSENSAETFRRRRQLLVIVSPSVQLFLGLPAVRSISRSNSPARAIALSGNPPSLAPRQGFKQNQRLHRYPRVIVRPFPAKLLEAFFLECPRTKLLMTGPAGAPALNMRRIGIRAEAAVHRVLRIGSDSTLG